MTEINPKNRLAASQLLHAMNLIFFEKTLNFEIDNVSSKKVEKYGFDNTI